MRDALIALALLAVLLLGGGYLSRRRTSRVRPAHVPPGDGRIVLRPPRRNAIMLGITALIPAGLLGALTLRASSLGDTSVGGVLTGVVATLVVLSVAVYEFAYALRAHIIVHDTGVERVGVFRRRLVGWGRVAKIAFNPVNHWFVVTVAGGWPLWLPADLAGMGDFASLALRRLPPTVLETADPVVREVLEELAGAAARSRP